MKEQPYFSELVYALEKALYYERGRGACFRVTRVGTDFIDQMRIEGDTAEEIIDNCIKVLIDNEIIKNATYAQKEDGALFDFEFNGCTHLPIETKLREEGVPPYVCPPTNMILHKIAQNVNLAVEIAEISVNDSGESCVVRVVVFEKD